MVTDVNMKIITNMEADSIGATSCNKCTYSNGKDHGKHVIVSMDTLSRNVKQNLKKQKIIKTVVLYMGFFTLVSIFAYKHILILFSHEYWPF